MHGFYSTHAFENAFTYIGNDLGAVWTKDKTAFRLWAPTASAVSVNLYRSGTQGTEDLMESIPMVYDVQGTWIAEKNGDIAGVYYTYKVTVGGKTIEACDPYARTTGVNGNRAMVIDLNSTNPQGWDTDTDPNAGKAVTDAVIYELHVRDLSMDRSSGIKNKGKYLGLIETGTKTKSGIPTGLDHMKALGITHLHLLPVYDFGFTDESREKPQFNWGYDPVNFNVPEGSYCSDPYAGAVRVKEMKQMVKGLHDNGISVVMDVVYNHVYELTDFCFNTIVPGYFSRIDAAGKISDASCCGNDTASERSMVRKYIVDSVNYWADEYHIDGFRFDLVGLIDTQTINEIVETVHRKHPNVIFYGEGWSMNTSMTKPGYSLTVQGNSAQVPGFAFFSDTIRDLLRGSVFDDKLPGFVSGAVCSRDQLDACFMGVPLWAAAPSQCVNYVSCHDNNTLIDRLALATPKAARADQVKMNNLAAAFTMLSQGIPFMQAGEELLRTKPAKGGGFDHNSYRSPDSVNSIKWNDLDKEEYAKTLSYYKGLIAFRKAHPSLRLLNRDDVWRTIHPVPSGNPHMVAFLIDGDEDQRIFAAFNADTHGVSITLPEGKWDVCIRDDAAGTEPLANLGGSVTVSPISALVLTQKKAAKPVDVVAALIWEKDKFLICQRPATKARGLLWEFVGGKVEPGETMAQALVRECKEELDVTVGVENQFMQVIHEYPDILIRLTLFHCTIPHGFPRALEHNDIRWIHPSEMDDYQFCPADADILKEIKRVYGNKKPL
ncbi:MAG: type I pullulanase [Oscillospiraceae bacterium]|nr:type I pullulanase [Oscillospiraceae bacterium]